MNGDESVTGAEGQDRSLQRYNRAHVCRVYELCGRDLRRAANLLGLTQEEVIRWVDSPDASEAGARGRGGV